MMRQKNREVRDRAIISAMLDRIDTINVAMHDEPFPYVVPLNYGYEWKGDFLVFYFHCAREGYKLDLLSKDPHVCVCASDFISYAGGSYRGHLHDYRSVIARGIAERIDYETDPEGFEHAHIQLLVHNHREIVFTSSMKYIEQWRITCRAEDVTAKAEIVPKTPEEVPFVQSKGDGMPLDVSHVLDMFKDQQH